MVRAVALFALLAVASAARRNRQKNKFNYPDASQYTVEGAETLTPGGTFQVQGTISYQSLLQLENPVLQYCPTDANLLGKFVLMPQEDTQEINWVANVLDKSGASPKVHKVKGTSVMQSHQSFAPGETYKMNNFSFIMSFNNYNYRVSVGSTDLSVRTADILLLNREYGLGNCRQFFVQYEESSGKMVLFNDVTTPGDPFNLVGLSDFTIQQTSQGGFRIDSKIDYYSTGKNFDDLDSQVVNTMDYSNYGSLCNFTDPWNGDYESLSDIRGRPKRKNKKNKNASGRCPSFLALARNYSGGLINLDTFVDNLQWAAQLGTYYGFEAEQPYYRYDGEKNHIFVEILAVQVYAEDDIWAVVVMSSDDVKIFLAQRTGLVDSQLSAQHLKHKETRNKMLHKQAQQSSGFFIAQNENAKKAAKIVPSSFQNDFKSEKPRSYKKGTKNKSVNKKRSRRMRKAAKKARVQTP
jgi:hypothetical protein